MVMMIVRGKKIGPLEQNLEAFKRHVESGEAVTFESEAGKKLGQYVPGGDPICPWDPSISAADLKAARDEEGGKPLSHVLAELGS